MKFCHEFELFLLCLLLYTYISLHFPWYCLQLYRREELITSFIQF